MADTLTELWRTGQLFIVAWVAVLIVLDTLVPLRMRKATRLERWPVNAAMTALVLVIGTVVVRPAALYAALWAGDARFGVSYLLPETGLARPVAAFLLMDLTFYWWHRVNHELPLLWRFHNVHHLDPDLDVSTSFRFHAGEVLYSTVFRVAQVAAIGIAPATFAAYELVFTCGTAFHHSNTRLPLWLERAVNRVFVTPRMHGIHHSNYREETNSNYSVVFMWWDVLHRTLRLNVRHAEIDIGVPGYSSPDDNTLAGMMAAPVVRQREYWLHRDGTLRVTRQPPAGAAGVSTMME